MTASHSPADVYSRESYRRIVQLLVGEGYAARPFTIERPQGKTVFLRHDVDYSLPLAVDLARINEELGVAGTFFIQLRSRLYNPFSYEAAKYLEEIVSRGQSVALHLTLSEKHRDYDGIYRLLKEEFETMRSGVMPCQPVFAWHNPGRLLPDMAEVLSMPFPGFVNVYGDFAGGRHPYYADSNMRYSVEEFEKLIREGTPVFQLALAPMQWLPGREAMTGVLAAVLVQKVRDCERGFMENDLFRQYFPEGLDEEILETFEADVLDKMRRKEEE